MISRWWVFIITPDNTIPIFWCEENWKSIFLRHSKIYGKGKVEFDDDQFI